MGSGELTMKIIGLHGTRSKHDCVQWKWSCTKNWNQMWWFLLNFHIHTREPHNMDILFIVCSNCWHVTRTRGVISIWCSATEASFSMWERVHLFLVYESCFLFSYVFFFSCFFPPSCLPVDGDNDVVNHFIYIYVYKYLYLSKDALRVRSAHIMRITPSSQLQSYFMVLLNLSSSVLSCNTPVPPNHSPSSYVLPNDIEVNFSL